MTDSTHPTSGKAKDAYISAATVGAFPFLPFNQRPAKPRATGLTEIRAAYYTPFGKNQLLDVLTTMGPYVDSIKFAGGAFTLMPEEALTDIIDTCHQHNVKVSTGGFMERVLTMGGSQAEAVEQYLRTCQRLGFDLVELSAGFITLPGADWQRLVRKCLEMGVTPKPEVGIQFGAGGASSVAALEEEGVQDAGRLVRQIQQFQDMGCPVVMVESEGITESVSRWRTDVVAKVVEGVGLERVMFEAAEPEVFQWYLKQYGPEVNLFVDHSQIVQLECLR